MLHTHTWGGSGGEWDNEGVWVHPKHVVWIARGGDIHDGVKCVTAKFITGDTATIPEEAAYRIRAGIHYFAMIEGGMLKNLPEGWEKSPPLESLKEQQNNDGDADEVLQTDAGAGQEKE